jgi:hypothetical protein
MPIQSRDAGSPFDRLAFWCRNANRAFAISPSFTSSAKRAATSTLRSDEDSKETYNVVNRDLLSAGAPNEAPSEAPKTYFWPGFESCRSHKSTDVSAPDHTCELRPTTTHGLASCSGWTARVRFPIIETGVQRAIMVAMRPSRSLDEDICGPESPRSSTSGCAPNTRHWDIHDIHYSALIARVVDSGDRPMRSIRVNLGLHGAPIRASKPRLHA